MNKVAIVTDSTCDLPFEILKENNVGIINLLVNFSNGESYADLKDINTVMLYDLVEKNKELPKTSAALIDDFYSKFKKLIDEGYDVFYTGISAALSRSYQNAIMAKEQLEVDNIYILDSKNLSTGIGLLILKAIKFRKEGCSAKEIYDKLEVVRENVRSQFAIETMDFLHKGGRCSSLARIFGVVLKIKPIIKVRDGKMTVGGKPRGKMKVALEFLLDMIKKDKDNLDTDNIFVTHSIGLESAAYLKKELKELFPNINILESQAGCVISSHCGKGTVGILYILANKEA